MKITLCAIGFVFIGILNGFAQQNKGLFLTIPASQYSKSGSRNLTWSQEFKCPISVGDQYQTKLQYQFYSASEVEFLLVAHYASKAYRPVKISINGVQIDDHFAYCFEENGSWSVASLKDVVAFTSIRGTNKIVLEGNSWPSGYLPFPHFHNFEIFTGVDTQMHGGCD